MQTQKATRGQASSHMQLKYVFIVYVVGMVFKYNVIFLNGIMCKD